MMRIALAQTGGSTDPQQNLETARRMVERAVEQQVGLLVFPEMFMALPRSDQPLGELAQPLDGPFVSELKKLAAAARVAIACGIWETSDREPQKAINAAIVIGEDGTIAAHYRKIHLFDALSVRESDRMIGGAEPPPVFTWNGLRVGLAICYDLRFPELFRYLSRQGAKLILVPSAWYAGPMKEEHWLTLLQARAIENTCYIAGVNLCGAPFAARSAVFDPFGVMVAAAGESETIVTVAISPERIKEIREKLPALQHARPRLFSD